MISAWTKGCAPEDKEKLEASIRASRPVLERAIELMKEMEADLDTYESSAKQYDNPNWACRQADNNGFRRCVRAISKLLTIDPKDK